MGYFTVNTRSNRVVIISSVITRIFFNSVQCLDGHITTCFNKDTHDLFMLCIMLMCQLHHVVFYIVVRFIIVVWFSFEFCSSFVQLLFSFDSFAFFSICSLFIVQKRKYSILMLDCIPGILIPLYVKNVFIIIYASQINIIHQTTPTLSLYRSEWPITIIDIAGYTEPIFSKL